MCEESLLILLIQLSLLHQGRSSMKTPEPLCCTPSPNNTESTQFPALCLTESLQMADRSSRHGGNTDSSSVQLCMTLCRPCHVRFVSYHVFILCDFTGPNTEFLASFVNVCHPVLIYSICGLNVSHFFQTMASLIRLPLHFSVQILIHAENKVCVCHK